MSVIYRYSDQITQIVLPPVANTPLPWGYAHSVYVLHGTNPALIDTGHHAASHLLLDALRELNISPERVQRVLLTGTTSSHVGNLHLFPRALAISTTDVRRSHAETVKHELEDLETVVSELLAEPQRDDSWERATFESFRETFGAEAALRLAETLSLSDGDAIAAAGFVFDTLSVSGAYGAQAVFYAADRRILFAGDILNVRPRPLIRDASALLDSIGKVQSMSLEAIFPAHGAVVDAVDPQLRSANLYTTNLRTNLQYLLSRPKSAAEIAAGDLGYWPKEMMRFAGLTLGYRKLLEELVAAGVATTANEDGRTLFQMGSAQGRHRMV